MAFDELPVSAAWRHGHSRDGFEVTAFLPQGGGYVIRGSTGAVENTSIWSVRYEIEVDDAWFTRRARVSSWQDGEAHELTLEADGTGGWRVDGAPDAGLDGCLDVDLEASAMTNALPVHRMSLPVDGRAAAPAAFVAVHNLGVHRLEQEYHRAPDDGTGHQYRYRADEFGFSAHLRYDRSGLVVHYPGIAERVR